MGLKRRKNRIRVWLVLLIIAVAILGTLLVSRYSAEFPPAQASLIVHSGSASLSHAGAGATPQTLTTEDDKALIGAGDTLEAKGLITIHFADGTETDLYPNARLRLDRFGKLGTSLQIAATLLTGQSLNRVGIFTDRRAFYHFATPPDYLIDTQNAQYLALAEPNRALIGTLNGTVNWASQSEPDDRLSIPAGSGAIIDKGKHPAAVQPWGWVRTYLYRPDGAALTLPVNLSGPTADSFQLPPDQPLLVPDGSYTLTVDLLHPYSLANVPIAAGKLNELPITLSEVTLSVVDSGSKLTSISSLVVEDDNQHKTSVRPDSPLLVGPGPLSLKVARSDAPSLWQLVSRVEVLPGQRLPVQLRNDLFGSGSLQVSVIGADGSPQSAKVSLYPDGSDESAPALLVFKSDSPPALIPKGRYVASVAVPNSIAARSQVEITTGQTVTLKIQLGTLVINYVDASGRASVRLLYVAAEDEMARLRVPLEKMNQNPYGYALYSGQRLTVPVGRYVVRPDDLRATPQIVTIAAGQNQPIAIAATP